MTLTTQKDTKLADDLVDIKYRELTPVIHQIFQICGVANAALLCEKDGETHSVDIHDIMLNVYINGFFFELHPDAYRDQFRAYNIVYVIVIAAALAIDLTRTARANRELVSITKQVQEKSIRKVQ